MSLPDFPSSWEHLQALCGSPAVLFTRNLASLQPQLHLIGFGGPLGVKDNPLFLLSPWPACICVSLINDVGLLGPAPAKDFNKVLGVIKGSGAK